MNGIKSKVVVFNKNKRSERAKTVLTMFLNGKDKTWVEFNGKQLNKLIRLLQNQRKIMRSYE